MIEKPPDAARTAANLLLSTDFADFAAERNALVRVLLEFYDAGASTCLARIERLEGLLMRLQYRVTDDSLRDEISEALRHD